MPVEAAASHSSGVTFGGHIDGEVQRHGTVTTSRIRQNIGVVTAFGEVRVSVPIEAAASHSSGVAFGRHIDGQVQRHDAVTANRVRQDIGVVAAFGEASVAVPVEAAASHGGGVTFGGHIDGEVQRHGTVTTSRIRQNIGVVTAFGEVRVSVPIKAAASHSSGVTFGGHIDGEVQRHSTVATRCVHQYVGIVTAFGEVRVSVPVEAAASHSSGVAFGRLIHRQGQHYDAVAGARTPDGVGILMDARSRCDDFKTVLVVAFTFTDGGGQLGDSLAAHRQVQNYHTVAAVSGLEVQLVVARRAGIEAVQVIDLALANLCREFRRGRRVQGKHQDGGVRAAVGIGDVMVVRAGLADGGVGQCPVVFGAAGVHRHFRIITVVDGEVQRHHTITTIGIRECLYIVS